ncbi:MAG: c-type cytochrome [Vicinamibacterales bacterium]|jgi:mono/diheme cytochrome c family protein|nr:c-type cytochrome [Vicinamibacterales bacterium]HJN45530.1 c-type cytochrome [Vicinamibacterales bacterium]|tara:strand:- start:2971 stop:3723 length:753 start_codon:yes stop_codon:yes gene_type:complete
MWKIVVSVLGPTLLAATTAVAQPVVDSVVFEEGQQLYRNHCTLCHQDSGAGDPPTFPALSAKDQLGDPARIVRSINAGKRRMPPFPALTAEEISSLANYIRNAWANDFGGVTTEEVTAVLEGLGETGPMASVWDGVFTEAQATRGQTVYAGACAICHGRRLNGAPDDPDMRSTPPLARARFVRVWEGRSLATLFEYTRAAMPEDNPSSLTDQENVDVIAYVLSVGGMPVGDDELQADPRSLARVVIEPRP